MKSVAATKAKMFDVERELGDLLIEAEEHIAPERREEFASKVELILLDTSIELIEVFSKESLCQSDRAKSELKKRWHALRVRSELLRRRNQLLSPASPREFEAALMWMAEQGGAEELEIIRTVRETPPFSSQNIEHLLGVVEERIISRTKA